VKIDTSTRNDALPLQDGLTRAQQGETASTATTGNTASSAPATSAGSTSGTSGDANVSLSNLSSSLRSLAASGSADIDTAHVQSIKDAIKNGTLQIDTGKIADGILETARGLVKPAASGS
jgi:negative regulator of flagellin synthesis FlgM